MDNASYWYKTDDGRWLASTAPLRADGLIEVTERDYLTETRQRERAAYDAGQQRLDAVAAAAKQRAQSRADLATKLGLTDAELSLLG